VKLAAALIPFIACVALAKEPKSTMTTERGMFSVAVGGGAGQQRLLNSTGGYSSFSGTGFGGNLDLRVFGEGQGELRVFGDISSETLNSKDVSGDGIKQSTTLLGLKSFFSESLYIGAGYGNVVQKVTSSGAESSFTNAATAVGLGYEYPMGANFLVGVHAWYQNNPIRNEGTLTGNSYTEGARLFINLIWSPPITTMIVNN